MIRNSIRNLVIGFAVGSLGLALAVAIPNVFSTGTVISSGAVNANFTAMKTAVDTLEAKVATLETVKKLPAQDGYHAYAFVYPGVTTLSGTGTYSFNPTGNITITNSSVGNYAVSFNGTHSRIRIAQVTPYSGELAWCNILNWSDSFVNIACYNVSGTPANISFTISVSN
jgi:outer membrane murein-binding lipoprotein Lpp